MTVYNRPKSEYMYEFEVIIPMENDIYTHNSYHTNGFIADQKATEVGGIILHNVRIQGKEKIK